jgi:hypothetical protein
MTQALVPDRDCGGCTVCCKHLAIDVPQLKKPAGVLCLHCHEAKGCAIYETRPDVCMNWYCGWRRFPLEDSWRPDRCGILITLVDEGIPSRYEKRVGLKFHLVDSLQSVLWEPCVHYIASLIESGVPVFLSVSGRDGHDARSVFLNDGMAAAIATHLDSAVARELQNVLDSSKMAQGVRKPIAP